MRMIKYKKHQNNSTHLPLTKTHYDQRLSRSRCTKHVTTYAFWSNEGDRQKQKRTSFLLSASADRTRCRIRVVGDVCALLLLCGLVLPSSGGFSRGPTLLPYAATTFTKSRCNTHSYCTIYEHANGSLRIDKSKLLRSSRGKFNVPYCPNVVWEKVFWGIKLH